ncbi:hypothetical protein BXZ70DRAFT_948040 [Cristinia sonorae]|uniref:Uncharacterized protein n=1 Tax=Cristinia sonorae TaxID=1940300 RepID=A0A8K0UKL1_9AGAR|nr:hypothetical protein BXZ70DRAFT_948040 [Cristinia sonorae]
MSLPHLYPEVFFCLASDSVHSFHLSNLFLALRTRAHPFLTPASHYPSPAIGPLAQNHKQLFNHAAYYRHTTLHTATIAITYPTNIGAHCHNVLFPVRLLVEVLAFLSRPFVRVQSQSDGYRPAFRGGALSSHILRYALTFVTLSVNTPFTCTDTVTTTSLSFLISFLLELPYLPYTRAWRRDLFITNTPCRLGSSPFRASPPSAMLPLPTSPLRTILIFCHIQNVAVIHFVQVRATYAVFPKSH